MGTHWQAHHEWDTHRASAASTQERQLLEVNTNDESKRLFKHYLDMADNDPEAYCEALAECLRNGTSQQALTVCIAVRCAFAVVGDSLVRLAVARLPVSPPGGGLNRRAGGDEKRVPTPP